MKIINWEKDLKVFISQIYFNVKNNNNRKIISKLKEEEKIKTKKRK